MQYEIILTEDGSHTVRQKESGVSFHSTRGALQESRHVFIESGLEYLLKHRDAVKKPSVFEAGFGTGLNALLSAMTAAAHGTSLTYTAVEAHPLPVSIFAALNYPQLLGETELYKTITQTPWNQQVYISPFFKLNKTIADIQSYVFSDRFDLIYFDAFAPNDQPELWTAPLFQRFFEALQPGGLLVTYCSKTSVRRDLESVGFRVEKIPGPPGKREIIRAFRAATV
ncbi:tRNA (5-methylaminomethyl-2-thiouridine)(34)-methyltransferase MnmD [Niabella terrae]